MVTYSGLYAQSTFSTIYNYTVEQGWPDPGGGAGLSVFETDTGFVVYGGQVAANFRTKAYQDVFDQNGQHLRHVKYFPTLDMNGEVAGWNEPIVSSAVPNYLVHVSWESGTDDTPVHLIEIGPSGDTLSSFLLEDSSRVVHKQLITNDQRILLFGSRSDSGVIDGAFLELIDTTGAVFFSNIYPQWYQFTRAIQTPNGGYALIGGWGGSTYIVIKVDSVGAVEWEHQLPSGITVPPLALTHDDQYLIAGRQPTGSSMGNVWLRKIDQNGDEVWTEVHDEYINYPPAGDLEVLPDGSSVYAFRAFDHNISLQATVLMKFDTLGNMLWARGVNHPDYYNQYYQPSDLLVCSDGGFAIAGSVAWGTSQAFPYLQMTWLAKTDSMGCIVPGCHTVGVPEYEAGALNIYPNPFTDRFNVEGIQRRSVVELFDLTGRPVPFQRTGNTIEMTSPTGIYVLRVNGLTYKVIKE